MSSAWLTRIGLAVAGTIALVACGKEPRQGLVEVVTHHITPQGCPGHDLSVVVRTYRIRGNDSSFVDTTIDRFPGITRRTSPEYHDCQKFITGDNYGSQLAIMPVDNVESELAALIVNYDEPYGPLGIDKGWSCLYMKPGGGPALFRAKITSHGESNTPPDCSADVDFDQLSDPELDVVPARASQENIPSAARWDREPGPNGRYYIGIRCGSDHYCEIGPRLGFHPSDRRRWLANWGSPGEMGGDIPKVKNEELTRILGIKTWYDEQILAEEGGGRALKPSNVLAYAFPHPSLHHWEEETQTDPREPWIPVAFVYTYGDYTPMGFRNGLNRIFLCKGDQTYCGVTDPRLCTEDSDDGEQWWAKIVPRGESGITYSCVTRKKHDGPLGAVRWRWSANDEKLWVRCQAGCCQVN